jgi:hypothetical protein
MQKAWCMRTPMTTQRNNKRSKLITVRLPHEMISKLKKLADKLGRPYQAVMKESIERGLPIVFEVGMTAVSIGLKSDHLSYRALNVDAAIERLKAASTRKKTTKA